MKIFEEYKGVAIIYLVITIISIIWISGVNTQNKGMQVNNNDKKQVVINYEK